MLNGIKVNIKNITSLTEHARIGLPLSIFFIVFGTILSLVFKQWGLFMYTAIFYIGILSGFEVKQGDLQEGWGKIKFGLQYKFIDSCCDVIAGSGLVIVTIIIVSFLM